MSWVPNYVVIPTHNRHQLVSNLAYSLINDVDKIFIIDNASTPRVTCSTFDIDCRKIYIIRDNEQPPNLSRLWNIGLNAARCHARNFDAARWNVAILNDDTVLPHDWYPTVSRELRAHNVAVACGSLFSQVHTSIIKTEPDNDLMTRMTPWAFITRGELGLRGDESMRWWWGDTDFDWTARKRGGMMIIPGYVTTNVLANSTTTGVLMEQAGRDRETFRLKWGHNPW